MIYQSARELFEKNWLPDALAIGISYHDFWHMNPHIIKIIAEGYQKKMRLQDEQAWRMGIYVQSAVATAVEHNLAGRKAKSKYFEKPMLQDVVLERKGIEIKALTEEDKRKQTEQLFHKLHIMGANFKINHKDRSVS